MVDPSLLQIIGGGVVGSSLTYALTWWRERRRIKDAYRAPQREAVGGMVSAIHELLVAESIMRDGAEQLAQHPDQITDAELDSVGNVFARGLYAMERAFSIGRVTVVDAVCREAMGDAYNEFALRTRALSARLPTITPDNAVELFPFFLHDFRGATKDLNIAVADLVEAAQGRVAPTQSAWNWWRRRGVHKRLVQRAARRQLELQDVREHRA